MGPIMLKQYNNESKNCLNMFSCNGNRKQIVHFIVNQHTVRSTLIFSKLEYASPFLSWNWHGLELTRLEKSFRNLFSSNSVTKASETVAML